MLLEALSDYEQIFLFKIPEMNIMEIQVYDLNSLLLTSTD